MTDTPLTVFLWHIVFANLFLLMLISGFIYRNTKDNVFLLYTFYNLSLIGYLLLKSENVVQLNSENAHIISSLNWWIQVVYNGFLTFFGIEFLSLRSKFKKETVIVEKIVKGLIIFFTIALLPAVLKQFTSYFKLFTFFYLPIQLGVSFYSIYLVTKTTERVKLYYFIGIFSYIGFALIAFVLTAIDKIFIGHFTAISFFYIGIIIEGLAFSYGLGQRIKNIYLEKIAYQTKLTKIEKELNLKLQQRVEKAELQKELAELKHTVLNSKMNSHFIFNALNSIKAFIIENDTRSAVNYLGKFAKLIRKILEISTVKEVSLEEELQNIQLYVDIENMRFNNDIDFQIHLPKNIASNSIKLPPFVLQPYVENAIWHGIATKPVKKIRIYIIELTQQQIQIEIIDNGIGRKQAKNRITHKQSLGLVINHEVLTQFFGNAFSVRFVDLVNHNQQATGTKVILKIPKPK